MEINTELLDAKMLSVGGRSLAGPPLLFGVHAASVTVHYKTSTEHYFLFSPSLKK